jgi:predicted alpha/beta hydrolase family esterase
LPRRAVDVDILMVPGWTNSGPEHWQSRWQQRLSTARRVEQPDWARPRKDIWVSNIVKAVDAARQPVVLVAHSLGVIACLHALPLVKPGDVIGAFLVAPIGETTIETEDAIDHAFLPIPRGRISVPAVVVASHDDPHAPFLTSEELAYGWGAELVDAGHAGHINTASGYGPWPEGLMKFAGFLQKL